MIVYIAVIIDYIFKKSFLLIIERGGDKITRKLFLSLILIIGLITLLSVNGIYAEETENTCQELQTADIGENEPELNAEDEPVLKYAAGAETENTLTSTGNSYTIAQMQDASNRVRNFIENNRRLPNFVTINNQQVQMSDFLHMLSTTTINLEDSHTGRVTQYDVQAPDYSVDKVNAGNIQRPEYVELARNILNKIETTGQATPSIESSQGIISYESQIYLYSRIVAFHRTRNRLPNFASISSWSGQKLPDSSPGTGPTPPEQEKPPVIKTYTLSQIQNAASVVRNYIETNRILPKHVLIANHQVPISDFLDLLTKATLNINRGINTAIEQNNLKIPDHSTEQINSGNIYRIEYIVLANNIQKYMAKENEAPFAITTTRGPVSFESQIYLYSRIVDFYGSRNRLPNFASINPWNGEKLPTSPANSEPVPLIETLSSPPHLNAGYEVEIEPGIVRATAKCTCGIRSYSNYHESTFVNYCVRCGTHGTLLWNPKGVVDGEWTCARCGADYCGATGKEKMPGSRPFLIRA